MLQNQNLNFAHTLSIIGCVPNLSFGSQAHPVIPKTMRKFEYFFQNFTNYKLRSNFEDCACSRTKTCILHTPRVPHRVFHAKIFLPDHTQSPKKTMRKILFIFQNFVRTHVFQFKSAVMKQLESINYIFFTFISGHVNKY